MEYCCNVVMVILLHTPTWGVVSEDRISYPTMDECRYEVLFAYELLPKDEFGLDGWVECRYEEDHRGNHHPTYHAAD